MLLLSCACQRPGPAELWLGGDVELEEGGHGALEAVSSITGRAPLVVNLEGAVAAPGTTRIFNAPAALAELKASGVVAVGVANNHAKDAGPSSVAATEAALPRAGLAPAGSRAAKLKLAGRTIAITSHDLEHRVPATLREDLKRARASADVLVATFHVTGPPSYLPTPELKEAVAIALESGASAVAAHGTHALGPVERRGGVPIAWGLGNVAFACDCTDVDEGALLHLVFTPGAETLAEIVPIRAGLKKAKVAAYPEPGGIFDLLEAAGSKGLVRRGARAGF